MLKSLELDHLGPGERLAFDFADRINVITGDNGLGKSFILDVAWWALTRQWAGLPAWPRPEQVDAARIAVKIRGKSNRLAGFESRFDRSTASWSGKPGRPANPGLVIFAQVNGGFAVYDPVRNYWKNAPSIGIVQPDRPAACLFEPQQVWDGIRRPATPDEKAATRLSEHVACRGLIEDWVTWQAGATEGDRRAFTQLETVLEELSPDAYRLKPGEPMDVPYTGDARRIPTVEMPYGQSIPAHYVSAGVRRIMSLAYLLVWAWQEHTKACRESGGDPTRRIVLLVDEIEAHLHPRWQRRILRSILRVAEQLESVPRVQLIAATHSPLVLASLEPLFDSKRDRLWVHDLKAGRVVVEQDDVHPRGTVDRWLASDVFDLEEPGSEEAETAMRLALAVLRAQAPTDEEVEAAEEALVEARLVAPGSAFGARWAWFKKQRAEGRA